MLFRSHARARRRQLGSDPPHPRRHHLRAAEVDEEEGDDYEDEELEEEDEQAEPCFWVVGGAYKDTHFTEPAGGTEQWYGPFKTYEDAKAEWQRRAWATVDDALSRFRIEKRTSDPRKD